MMESQLRELRVNGNRPRVHGNGFIQLDITPQCRLHVWGDPRIPKQKTCTSIHDHVFNFRSEILVGTLINVVYNTTKLVWGDYNIYTPHVRNGEDTVLHMGLNALQVLVSIDRCERISVDGGRRSYNMPAFRFHDTFVNEPTATVIYKDGITQAQGATATPRVLVPVGKEPDNDFNRYDADEGLLWRIIEDTVARG